VGSKHFQNKARRSYWSVHIQAWRQSGLTRTEYCRQHRLTKSTFDRWLKALDEWESLQNKGQERRRRAKHPLSADKRNKAVQAFWAMHVEAMTWCGLSVREYAAAHRLSPHSLKRWRDLLDDGEVEIDWRARLHPSALPKISTSASSGAKETSAEIALTAAPTGDPPRDRRSNRRSFTDEEKLAIVLEAEAPGVSAAAVARRHDIVTSMIFRWRVQFGFGKEKPAKLAAVRVADEQPGRRRGDKPAALVLHDLLAVPDGMAAVELPDGRRVFAPAGADPEAVRRHVFDRETAP